MRVIKFLVFDYFYYNFKKRELKDILIEFTKKRSLFKL